MIYTDEQKAEAKKLFLKGSRIPEIEVELDISRRTLYNWVNEERWGEEADCTSVLYAANRRMLILIDKENKQDADIREINCLTGIIEKFKRIENNGNTTEERTAESKRKRNRRKNDFSDLDPAEFYNKHFSNGLFPYQLDCWNEKNKYKNRQYLKARQIGFTYYFAGEAFADALMTGDNQIFISASRK